MELLDLKNNLLEKLGLATVEELPGFLLEHLNDNAVRQKVIELLPDLNQDYLQAVYQYYLSDRKNKKQDFTPINIAKLIASMTSEDDRIIDFCAGSGALTIQKWVQESETFFECYELDEQALSFLLFNLALRKIEANVYHADVLKDEVFAKFEIRKGVVSKIDSSN